MGERLKFSFGHVMAFISLMFIGYVTFMGAVYFTGANFTVALVSVGVEVILLFALVMLLQKMKTVKHNFRRNIRIERILVMLFVLVCCVAFVYFMKFWNVFENRRLVSERFIEATASADKLFVGYDDYSDERIQRHRNRLKTRYALSDNQLLYKVDDSILRLKLQSPEYKEFEENARVWIKSTSNGVSVWNVFMLGNEKKMATVIDRWYEMMVSMSSGNLSTEDNAVPYDFDGQRINNAHSKIASLESLFATDGFTMWSLLGIPAFLMLFLPYFIQDRYFRSTYILFGWHSARDGSGKLHTYWGRDRSWVERNVNNVVIDTNSAGRRTKRVVEKIHVNSDAVKVSPIVTHVGEIAEKDTVKIVVKGTGDVSNVRSKRRRTSAFDYDRVGEIKSVVTQMTEK